MIVRLNLSGSDPRIEWPVVVVDGDDVCVFDDLAALVMGVEEPDVFDVEVFDARGFRLHVTLQDGNATVMRDEPATEHLGRVLLRFLDAAGNQSDPNASLLELIHAARQGR